MDMLHRRMGIPFSPRPGTLIDVAIQPVTR